VERDLEQQTLAAEDDHWWYRGRRAIVGDAVRRLLPEPARPRSLDAGCGGGRMLADLAQIGEATGLEPSPVSRARALERRCADVVDGSLEQLPFSDSTFDLALALDVLEHLDDDRRALAEMRRVVRPGGGAVVTVPAHPWLWSAHDDLNHHRRRYRRDELEGRAADAGWSIAKRTHFNLLLLPLVLAGRRLVRGNGLAIPPAPVNRALQGALQAERVAIASGLRLPAGASLLLELRRSA
jgi:SAM-dependent methyltransferase